MVDATDKGATAQQRSIPPLPPDPLHGVNGPKYNPKRACLPVLGILINRNRTKSN